jgi:hypothetical protein
MVRSMPVLGKGVLKFISENKTNGKARKENDG